MLLRELRALIVLALVAVGCGSEVDAPSEPSDWMLGTFSTRGVPHRSVGLTSLGHYVFHEDGTLERIAITGCEENQEELLQEYEWSRAGDALVIVDMPDGDTFEEWLVTLGDTCNTLEVDQIQDGAEVVNVFETPDRRDY